MNGKGGSMKICPMCEKEITGDCLGIGGFGLVHKECGMEYLNEQKRRIESICKMNVLDDKKIYKEP